jgi:hypothetical protein
LFPVSHLHRGTSRHSRAHLGSPLHPTPHAFESKVNTQDCLKSWKRQFFVRLWAAELLVFKYAVSPQNSGLAPSSGWHRRTPHIVGKVRLHRRSLVVSSEALDRRSSPVLGTSVRRGRELKNTFVPIVLWALSAQANRRPRRISTHFTCPAIILPHLSIRGRGRHFSAAFVGV